jgi:hypothetical protein
LAAGSFALVGLVAQVAAPQRVAAPEYGVDVHSALMTVVGVIAPVAGIGAQPRAAQYRSRLAYCGHKSRRNGHQLGFPIRNLGRLVRRVWLLAQSPKPAIRHIQYNIVHRWGFRHRSAGML